MLEEIGFVDVAIGPLVDTFGGASGEKNARGPLNYLFGSINSIRLPKGSST
jgi:hypothetical protein